MVQPDRLINLFIELVRIDSETGYEQAICQHLIAHCQQLGLHAYEDDSAARTGHGAGNIIACSPSALTIAKQGGGERPFLLTCHMDTVAPGRGIQPRIEGEALVSDGTTILGSDDKAGLAALLEGLRAWQEQGLSWPPIELVLTVGEEAGLVGAQHLKAGELRARYGFALDCDGPVGTVVVSAPAQARLRVVIEGCAAHAGLAPEKGISAIQIASRAIAQMRLGRIDQETTANIGRFQGGGATNVVPDYVEISAEARSCQAAKLSAQVEHMEQIFVQTATTHGGRATVTVEWPYPSFNFTASDPVVQHAIAALKAVDREPCCVQSGGASDANVLNQYGIPTINLGIGYEHVHTVRERLPLSELIKSAELVMALLARS